MRSTISQLGRRRLLERNLCGRWMWGEETLLGSSRESVQLSEANKMMDLWRCGGFWLSESSIIICKDDSIYTLHSSLCMRNQRGAFLAVLILPMQFCLILPSRPWPNERRLSASRILDISRRIFIIVKEGLRRHLNCPLVRHPQPTSSRVLALFQTP